MSISRAKGAGFGIGDKLTSSDLNSIDLNIENALDKRASQTDTLESVVSLGGAGRIVSTVYSAPDSTGTISVGSGVLIKVTNLTAARTYTLGTSGAASGDVLSFFFGTGSYKGTITYNGGSSSFVLGGDSSSDGRWADFYYDGSAWQLLRNGQGCRLYSQNFTSNGSWTAPPGVTYAIVSGCGGGGGGGGGTGGRNAASVSDAGGAGGGGAMLCTRVVPVNPASSYTVTIGAGGSGGAANSEGTSGSSTTFDALATFKGGQGGGNPAYTWVAGSAVISFGGAGIASAPRTGSSGLFLYDASQSPQVFGSPSQGGASYVYSTGSHGALAGSDASGDNGYSGGAAGANGSNGSSYYGGTAGGGGAAGPYGAGGTGGNGGSGNDGGTGSNATNGAAASSNTGAGGGGGGTGGCGSVAGGNAGTGGNGGSGRLTVTWVM